MRRIAAVFLALIVLTGSAFGAGGGPQIRIIDKKVSIQADAIPLSRLLHLLDEATGMTSKSPPELANRNISVRFSGLSFDDAVKRIFEGQPFDYVFLGGRGIVVTALSQAISPETGAPAASLAATEPNPENNKSGQPLNGQAPMPGNINTPGGPGKLGAPGVPGAANNGANIIVNQPTPIQTPYELLPNPYARAAVTQPAGQQPAVSAQLGVPIPTISSSPTPSSTVGTRAP